jgi:hypothetical protein
LRTTVLPESTIFTVPPVFDADTPAPAWSESELRSTSATTLAPAGVDRRLRRAERLHAGARVSLDALAASLCQQRRQRDRGTAEAPVASASARPPPRPRCADPKFPV